MMRAVLLAGLLALASRAFGDPGLDVLRDAAAGEVGRHPGDPLAHLRLGKVCEMAGEWDAALAAFGRAAELGADADEVGLARGRVLLAAGRPRLAKREIDRVLARRPDSPGALLERGRAWRAVGYPEKAARDLGRAIARLSQPTPEHVFERRDALLAAGEPARAVRALDAGIARLGPVPSLELAAIALEVELGRPGHALARIDTLLASNPRNETWVTRRGELLEQAGRHEEARAAFTTALALIEARPARRRGKQIEALEHRLRTALAPAVMPTEGNP